MAHGVSRREDEQQELKQIPTGSPVKSYLVASARETQVTVETKIKSLPSVRYTYCMETICLTG